MDANLRNDLLQLLSVLMTVDKKQKCSLKTRQGRFKRIFSSDGKNYLNEMPSSDCALVPGDIFDRWSEYIEHNNILMQQSSIINLFNGFVELFKTFKSQSTTGYKIWQDLILQHAQDYVPADIVDKDKNFEVRIYDALSFGVTSKYYKTHNCTSLDWGDTLNTVAHVAALYTAYGEDGFIAELLSYLEKSAKSQSIKSSRQIFVSLKLYLDICLNLNENKLFFKQIFSITVSGKSLILFK